MSELPDPFVISFEDSSVDVSSSAEQFTPSFNPSDEYMQRRVVDVVNEDSNVVICLTLYGGREDYNYFVQVNLMLP